MAMKTFAPVLLVVVTLFAFATPSTAARSRHLLTSTCSSGDQPCYLNQALIAAHVRANLLSCALTGNPISGPEYCGPHDGPVNNCKLIDLSAEAKLKAQGLLVNALDEVRGLRLALGAKVKILPAIDIKLFINAVLKAALAVDIGDFDCFAGDDQFFLAVYILLDLQTNIFVSLKFLLTSGYLQVVLNLLPVCQRDLSLIQAALSLIADVVICAGLKVSVVVNLCLKYLDCGLCGVLGLTLQCLVGSILNLVSWLLIDVRALISVFLKLCGIVQLCIV